MGSQIDFFPAADLTSGRREGITAVSRSFSLAPEYRPMHYNPRRLFVASCLALITSAFSFQMRQNVADDVAGDFLLTKQVVGGLMGGQFLGMALAMLVFSPLCDALGMGKVLALAWLCHATGISGTIFAKEVAEQGFASGVANGLAGFSGWMSDTLKFSLMPNVPGGNTAFWVLWLAAFLIGSANGLVEVAINPLAATIYPDQKTHKLNVLHAWWPGGLIIAGLLALFFVNPLFGKEAEFFGYKIDPARLGLAELVGRISSWRFKYGLIYIPLLLYGLLSVGQRFPATERVQANVSTTMMFLQILRPLFIIWAFCMLLTSSTELGVNAWMQSFLSRTAGVSGTLVFVYTTMLMFILRFFAGPLAHKFSPVGMLFLCSILTAAGLYWLSYAHSWIVFAAATVFGLGIAYYWPTMLGVTAERFPKGGALLLGLMGCVGNLAISQVTPLMGAVYDSYTVANLPSDLRDVTVSTPDGPQPLVKRETIPSWVPPEVSQRIYPAGGEKLNPAAREALEQAAKDDPAKRDKFEMVEAAEKEGAAWSYRWTTVLPCALVVIFGLIGLVDKLRGGYRQVHLTTAPEQPRKTVHAAPPGAWPRDQMR
jgi:fucose permease